MSQQVESTTAALLQLPDETAYSSFAEVFIICYEAEAPTGLSSFLLAGEADIEEYQRCSFWCIWHTYAAGLETVVAVLTAAAAVICCCCCCCRVQASHPGSWFLWCLSGAEQECCAGWAGPAVPNMGPLDQSR